MVTDAMSLTHRPNWVATACKIGAELAAKPNAGIGKRKPVVFLSVPTGQFLAPLLMAGALTAPPKIADPKAILGETFRAVSFDGESQVRDLSVTLIEGQFQQEARVPMFQSGGYWRKTDHPILRLPAGVPDDRGAKVLNERDWAVIKGEFKALSERPKPSAEIWWASHCLSPVVIVGESLEYVDKQRQILVDQAERWFEPDVLPFIRYSKPGTGNADRVLHHPYSYLTTDADKTRPWLRRILPRLVVYTSWRAYFVRVESSFSSAPTVVLVNRRVWRSDVEAAQNTLHDTSVKLESLVGMPRSFGARVMMTKAVEDHGEVFGRRNDDFDYGGD